jgi:hypothetical protein
MKLLNLKINMTKEFFPCFCALLIIINIKEFPSYFVTLLIELLKLSFNFFKNGTKSFMLKILFLYLVRFNFKSLIIDVGLHPIF